MEDIERMAALCMKDLEDDEDYGDLENDADLLVRGGQNCPANKCFFKLSRNLNKVTVTLRLKLVFVYQAELNEVMDDDKEEVPLPSPPQRSSVAPRTTPTSQGSPGSLESQLQERIDMYQTAITNAKAVGETSKARRYDRGLKVGHLHNNYTHSVPYLCLVW